MQHRLLALNPQLVFDYSRLEPDGDAHVADELANSVEIPNCEQCDGILKPNVVFYGGSVDRHLVASVYEKLKQVDALLVVGSSLMVFSSFRFCRRAFNMGIPVAAVNKGKTRADEFLSLKLGLDCETTLRGLVLALR